MFPQRMNGNDSKYWNPEKNCPMVYVASQESEVKSDAKSEKSVGWGFQYSDRKGHAYGGPVSGAQNEFRGQLTAAKEALEWNSRLIDGSKIDILSPDDRLMNEAHGHRTPGNEDLWKDIDKLSKNVDVSFETVIVGDDNDTKEWFAQALNKAQQGAKK